MTSKDEMQEEKLEAALRDAAIETLIRSAEENAALHAMCEEIGTIK